MSDIEPADLLFDEFPATPTQAWEERIQADLGNVDYDVQLLWHPYSDLEVRPYYRAEDLDGLPHLGPAADGDVSIGSSWSIQQNIRVLPPDEAERRLRDASEGGVEILGLDLTSPHQSNDPARGLLHLADLIDISLTGVHVEAGISSLEYLDPLLRDDRGAFRAGVATTPRSITAAFDPMAELARSGRYRGGWKKAVARATEELPSHVRLLQVSAGVFHEAGADLINETAFSLAAVSEYLTQLIDHGLPIDRIVGRLFVSLEIGSSYFLEIARLRALRLLLHQLIGAFDAGTTSTYVPIHASVSRRNMTLYDPHSNLLRASTEAASAVIGGCDVLVVHPFDDVGRDASEFACRLARNIQHLLRHEAYLEKVNDPSAGSYYVEALTDALGRSAWQRFQEIERQGGLLKALERGTVHEHVRGSRDGLMQDLARQDRILVGTNWYPNPDERRLGAAPESDGSPRLPPIPNGKPEPGEIAVQPLEPRRAAEAIESLRLRTERYAAHTGRRPSAGILPCGEPSVRSARAHFAANFLGCAGLAIRMKDPVETAAALQAAAMTADVDLLVVAGSDACYHHNVIHELRSLNQFMGIGIVATSDVLVGADFHLYEGADLIQALSTVQQLIGITS